MTKHIDLDELREEAHGAIEDGSYDGAGWASYTLLLSEALDQAEARIKAVRDVLDEPDAMIGTRLHVSVDRILRALDGER